MILSYNDRIMAKTTVTPHPLARHRGSRGWSQAQLARRTGIPRTSVSAIECERLVPSVATALALARALECTVEELFGPLAAGTGSGQPEWAWEPASDPCRYWEAEVGGRQLRYPAQASVPGAARHDGIWRSGVAGERHPEAAGNTLVLACCDPSAGLLAAAYRKRSGFRLLPLQRGGAAALDLLRRGLVHVAGLHRSTPEQPDRNRETVARVLGEEYRLVRAARWQAGVAVARDGSSPSLASLAGRSLCWAMREPGAAARECLDELLGGEPAGGRIVRDHATVAATVEAGWADAGVCVRLVAEEAGLNFLTVHDELLDFCFPRSLAGDARVRALISLLRSRSHRRMVGELPGYDAHGIGEVSAP